MDVCVKLLWSYLWFSQFMLLIWYSNIPEEVIYFTERIENYQNFILWNIYCEFLLSNGVLHVKRYKKVAGYFDCNWLDDFCRSLV